MGLSCRCHESTPNTTVLCCSQHWSSNFQLPASTQCQQNLSHVRKIWSHLYTYL